MGVGVPHVYITILCTLECTQSWRVLASPGERKYRLRLEDGTRDRSTRRTSGDGGSHEGYGTGEGGADSRHGCCRWSGRREQAEVDGGGGRSDPQW